MSESEIADFEQALLSLDQVTATRLLRQSCLERSPQAPFEDVVIPALVRIGAGWEAGSVSLAQVYMSGKMCQRLIAALPPTQIAPRSNQPRMAIGILEDSHVLGKQIVVQMLLSAGYSVADWGARLSVDDLVSGVVRERIEVLFISVLMLRSALLVAQVRDALDQQGEHPILIVGGAPFRFDPALASEVGADFVGRSASDALAILAELASTKGRTPR
ncbi:MAG: cobalamin-dependent protein [Actinomycetes bacterium]